MVNDSKTSENGQSKKTKFESYYDLRKTAQDELIKTEENLNTKKIEISYGHLAWEDFLELEPDTYGQAEASQIIDLQVSFKDYQKQKQSFESTIYLEPSKLPEVIEAAEKLLLTNNNHIYQRAGRLVRVTKISNAPQGKKQLIVRAQEAMLIKEIDQAFLTMYLTEIGTFVVFDSRIGNLKKIDCPEKIARYLLAKDQWGARVLVGIINAPTLRSDGSILDQPGYDPDSGLLFEPGNYEFEKIKDRPTLEDALNARDLLLELLKDFPFEDEVSKSVAIAAILTALVRKSVPTAPLFGFTAPKMASGKSLLADVVSLIATGKINSVIAQAENETEEKKRILAVLIEGDPIVCFDNIEKPFRSAALCSILTQQEYKDRLLGGNETRTVPTNTTFLVTGNNLVFMGDITTRALLSKLDPEVENPGERRFARNLREYIPEHRSSLVKAALIILRAYFIADKSSQNIQPFGRFEEWSNLVRSAIIWVGMEDPYESCKEIEQCDPIRLLLSSLYMCWYEIFGDDAIKLKQLVEATESKDIVPEIAEPLRENLQELAADTKGVISQKVLAKKLSEYKKRIEGGLFVENAGKHQGVLLWHVKKAKKP